MPVLLHDTDYSNAATAAITSGINSTYGEYIFRFYNINPATDGANFTFQVNATDDAGGGYDTSLITSTYWYSLLSEDGGTTSLAYSTSEDQAQGSAFQSIGSTVGNGADESLAGELHLFNPSSTTYVKHFYSRTHSYHQSDHSMEHFAAGYINDTTAIDEIQFKMSSGNFDGVIQLYGIA